MSMAAYIILALTGTATAAYVLIIATITFGWFRKDKISAAAASASPFISVIIAARNEEQHIGNCLEALFLQDYSKEHFEVFVVDDASSDQTPGCIHSFIASHPGLCIRALSLAAEIPGAAGKKAALALGVGNAKGGIIAVTDADCIPGRGWISAIAGSFSNTTISMVCGLVCFREEKKCFAKLQSLEFMSLVAAGAGASGAGFPFMCNGASMAFRKQAFYETGAYAGNDSYATGDDVFLLHNIKRLYGASAIRFLKNESAIVQTSAQPGVSSFIQQRIRWASKARGYHDLFSLMTSYTIFVFSLLLFVFAIYGCFYLPALLAASAMFILKLITDIPLMAGITDHFGQKRLLFHYLPMQLIYPVYVVVTALGGLFGKYSWKGRSLKLF